MKLFMDRKNKHRAIGWSSQLLARESTQDTARNT